MSTVKITASLSDERTLKDLTPNVAALLCYVAGWVSGIVFLVLEQKNRFVRFHALQSIIIFAILSIAGGIFGRAPVVSPVFSAITGVAAFVIWILLIVKSQSSDIYKFLWAGDLAERLTIQTLGKPETAETVKNTGVQAADSSEGVKSALDGAQNTDVGTASSEPAARKAVHEKFNERYYSSRARAGRMAGSIFVIAWSLALLIFFNFFNQYIAYYVPVNVNGISHWEMYTLVTKDFNLWLPVVNAALIMAIIGHAVLIAFDRYILRQSIHIILDIFTLMAVVSLLVIFPFNFSVLPGNTEFLIATGLTVALVLIAIGSGIGIIVRLITLVVRLAQGQI